MKTFTRWLLTLVLAAVPMLAVINTASANSELVPASRLVGPYLTVGGAKSTFLLLTNISTLNLQGLASPTAVGSIHLEFYNRNCDRTDRPIHLSQFDIDQVNVVPADFSGGLTEGWVDLDVRIANPAAVPPQSMDSPASTSARANALLGEVVITDSAADYTLSYPMVSILGSSAGAAVLSPIVTRAPASALAAVWTGRYEPLPTTIDLPGYYAEGGAAATAGTVTESLLAIASPADGNWYGTSAGCAPGCGEAPGQALATVAALGAGFDIINIPSATVYDGCENPTSQPLRGHYKAFRLTSAVVNDGFGPLLDRSAWGPAAGCSGAGFPRVDELAGVPVGWVNLPNISCVRSANNNWAATLVCAGGAGNVTPTAAKIRGVAGIFFEAAIVSGGAGATRGADVARLWGERNTIITQTFCLDSLGNPILPAVAGTGTCKYNMESAIGASALEP